MNIAEPGLIAYLLRQRSPCQEDLAREMRTSQPTVSRLLRSRGSLDDGDYADKAATLALGRQREDETQPRWTVTRWHASGLVEDPPLTADGELPLFASFATARAVADYLRLFRAGTVVPVPVWTGYVEEQAKRRDIANEQVCTFDLDTDHSLDELDRLLRRLQRGFAMQAPLIPSLSAA
jgi:hypothetical protein